MRNRALRFGLVILLLAAAIGWQVAACYWANTEFQSDMKAIAVQNRFRIGMDPPPTEEGLRDSVIAAAREHGIQLEPRQVSVDLSLISHVLSVSLAANYEARVNLIVKTFTLHFTPSGSYSAEVIVK